MITVRSRRKKQRFEKLSFKGLFAGRTLASSGPAVKHEAPTLFFSLLAYWPPRQTSMGLLRGLVRSGNSLPPTPVLQAPAATTLSGRRSQLRATRWGGIRDSVWDCGRVAAVPWARPSSCSQEAEDSFFSFLAFFLSLVPTLGSRSTLHLLFPKFILQLWVNLAGIPRLR